MYTSHYNSSYDRIRKITGIALFWLIIIGWKISHAQGNFDNGWSNPALIQGASFGNVLQGYYKTGNYDILLQLTSTKSRKKFTDTAIVDYYKRMQFGYNLKLIAAKKRDNSWILTYRTSIFATETIINMRVAIEKDTCRIILPNDFSNQKIFLFR